MLCGMTDQPLPEAALELSVLLERAQHAVRLRQASAQAERQVVETGRGMGWSWDRIGQVLDVPGETLRRRYRGVVA